MTVRFVSERVLFAGLPAAVLVTTIVLSIERDEVATDFRTVAPEIRGLVHGDNPYFGGDLSPGGFFLWPILAGLLLIPIAWLPQALAGALVTAGEVACLVGALRLLGVRDWRVYGLALAWPATVNSVQTGNLTLPLCLLLALAWRFRASIFSGAWIGLAIAVKLLAWPLLAWLAATRRWRALLLALAVQAAALLLTLPFVSLPDYVDFNRRVEDTFSRESVTFLALLQDLGVGERPAQIAVVSSGLLLLWLGRRSFAACVVVALLVTPVAWLHYFDLLLVPLALWRARLWVWALPLGLVVLPGELNGEPWQTALALAVVTVTLAAARAGAPPSPARASAGGVDL